MSSCIRIKTEKVKAALDHAIELEKDRVTRKWDNLYWEYLHNYNYKMWFKPKYPMSKDQFMSDYRKKNTDDPDRCFWNELKHNLKLAIEVANKNGDKYIYLSIEDNYTLLKVSEHYLFSKV